MRRNICMKTTSTKKFIFMDRLTRNTSPAVISEPRTPAAGPSQSAAASTRLSNKTYDIFTIPPVFTFTTASDNGTGAAAATQYIFNNSFYNAADTDNGSGAGSIVNTYGDGFTGKGYEQLLNSANGGHGVLFKGFLIISTTSSSGAQYPTAFTTINFTLLNANLQGSTIDIPFNISSAQNNMQYQSGTLTIDQRFWMNSLNQISVSLPANTTYAFTFYTEESQQI